MIKSMMKEPDMAILKPVPSLTMKIFSGNQPEKTEEEVNRWLQERRVVIHHIGQSQCERNGNLLLLITVYYHELN